MQRIMIICIRISEIFAYAHTHTPVSIRRTQNDPMLCVAEWNSLFDVSITAQQCFRKANVQIEQVSSLLL